MSALTTTAVACGSFAAIVTALKVMTGFAPFRWVWKRLVHDPVQEGLRTVVTSEVSPMLSAALAELRPNHGESFRDVVDRASVQLDATQVKLDEFMAYQHDRNHDVLNRMSVVSGFAQLLQEKVTAYMTADEAAHEELRAEFTRRAELGLQMAARVEQIALQLDVDHEVDVLGRGGEIERRRDDPPPAP